ncbi:FAD-dependent oxidoreductase [Micromonospora sp. NPDC047707]|uniref:FAD-dependent oxidoreductase n=1 Tax=Micromonospora sp. NPDC047707 TaxID=3154498 RepID=UPI0034546CD9
MTKALIVGAGIAGAATAIALRRVGIDSVVYERHPVGGGDGGAFLTVMSNGMAALRSIDVQRPVVENSFPARSVEIFNAAGEHLDHRFIAADDDGPRTLARARLCQVLQAEAVARGVRIEHGKRLVAGELLPGGGVGVSFADGSRAEGDLLVGADGIRSVTRGLIDPSAPRPRYTGHSVVYGYAPAAPAATSPDAYHMIFGTQAFFGYTTPPDGRTWWFARLPGIESDAAERMTVTVSEWKRRVQQAFLDDRVPVDAIVEATGDDVVGGDSYDIPTTRRWHNGSMVVVGDAAHAASPAAAQGASMALEDAVALATCLRDTHDVAEAFTVFEASRREPAEATVAASADMSRRRRPGTS